MNLWTLVMASLSFAGTFGVEPTLKKPTPLADARAGSEVLLEGQVQKVCKKSGCWMVVKSGKDSIRVTFKDYGFKVPASILNRTVWIQGEVQVKELSIAERKHYLRDDGASEEEVAKITEPTKEYRFVATGVKDQG